VVVPGGNGSRGYVLHPVVLLYAGLLAAPFDLHVTDRSRPEAARACATLYVSALACLRRAAMIRRLVW
jgi:hypothetical protein